MAEVEYRNRRAHQIENDDLRVVVLQEGGHIAEILHKHIAVNPLWTPPWESIEPSTYHPAKHPEYGNDAESKLLSGIMGHNLCLDLFGDPSPEEAVAGMTVHGEASVEPYEIASLDEQLTSHCSLHQAGLEFDRTIRLRGNTLMVQEAVTNVGSLDRPIAWTQHVTLGPPFLEAGVTQFRTPATKSYCPSTKTIFRWPRVSLGDSVKQDLRVYAQPTGSRGATSHLMDPTKEWAFFFAFSSRWNLLFGYVWKRADFPWLAIWDENCSAATPPWNHRTVTRGMEFGVSPIPESRRKMIERKELFGVPCFRWVPARTTLSVEYYAFAKPALSVPDNLDQLELTIPCAHTPNGTD